MSASRYATSAPPCLIGMEACPGAHHLGRKLELFPLFYLAAAVDDEGHFLAVLHRLGGNSFGAAGVAAPNMTSPGGAGCELLRQSSMGAVNIGTHFESRAPASQLAVMASFTLAAMTSIIRLGCSQSMMGGTLQAADAGGGDARCRLSRPLSSLRGAYFTDEWRSYCEGTVGDHQRKRCQTPWRWSEYDLRAFPGIKFGVVARTFQNIVVAYVRLHPLRDGTSRVGANQRKRDDAVGRS